jgi:hypothetical protein
VSEKSRRLLKRILLGLAIAVVLAVAGMTYMVGGPRNLIGMLRYDQREEGTLRVGDRAPDVALVSLDGTTPVRLAQEFGGKPTVLVFGSFT